MIEHSLTLTGDKDGVPVGDLERFIHAAIDAGSGEHAAVKITTNGATPTLSVTIKPLAE